LWEIILKILCLPSTGASLGEAAKKLPLYTARFYAADLERSREGVGSRTGKRIGLQGLLAGQQAGKKKSLKGKKCGRTGWEVLRWETYFTACVSH